MLKNLKGSILGLVILLWSTQVFAGRAYLFLIKCLGCHSRTGKPAPISPADRSSSVWEKYFKRNRHPIDLSRTITSEKMQAIIETLKEHAADIDQPAAAIIPK